MLCGTVPHNFNALELDWPTQIGAKWYKHRTSNLVSQGPKDWILERQGRMSKSLGKALASTLGMGLHLLKAVRSTHTWRAEGSNAGEAMTRDLNEMLS